MDSISPLGRNSSSDYLLPKKKEPDAVRQQKFGDLMRNILSDGWGGIRETAKDAVPPLAPKITDAPPSTDLYLLLSMCAGPFRGESLADSVQHVFRNKRLEETYGALVPPAAEEARRVLELEWEAHPLGDTIAMILQRWMTDVLFLSTLLGIIASWEESRKSAIRAAIEEAKHADLLTAFDAAMRKEA